MILNFQINLQETIRLNGRADNGDFSSKGSASPDTVIVDMSLPAQNYKSNIIKTQTVKQLYDLGVIFIRTICISYVAANAAANSRMICLRSIQFMTDVKYMKGL